MEKKALSHKFFVGMIKYILSFNPSKLQNYSIAEAGLINILIYLNTLCEKYFPISYKSSKVAKITKKNFHILELFLMLFKAPSKNSLAVKQLFLMRFLMQSKLMDLY